jgi:hypothetical protein
MRYITQTPLCQNKGISNAIKAIQKNMCIVIERVNNNECTATPVRKPTIGNNRGWDFIVQIYHLFFKKK